MLKNQTRLYDRETNEEWSVQKRTKGPDVVRPGEPPVTTWTLILSNRSGERRFVNENRVPKLYKMTLEE